jgi:hypothetical protein
MKSEKENGRWLETRRLASECKEDQNRKIAAQKQRKCRDNGGENSSEHPQRGTPD